MRIQDLRTLYDYNAWANARLLGQAANMPDDQFASAALGGCSLRDALRHIMAAEFVWRLRLQGLPLETLPPAAEFPTLESLRARWQVEAEKLDVFLNALTDDDLAGPITFQGRDGETTVQALWPLLVHVVNHGTQHRAEAALVLTDLGLSPGDMDFTVFLRQTGRL